MGHVVAQILLKQASMSNIVKLIRNCFSTPNLTVIVDNFPTLEDQELASIEKKIQDLIDTVAHMSRELNLEHLTEAILGLRLVFLEILIFFKIIH